MSDVILQGFQVLCDIADGFAGLGSKVTEMLHDSYAGKGVLTWGLSPVNHRNSVSQSIHCFYLFTRSLFSFCFISVQTPMTDFYHLLNCVLGTVHLARHSSLFCPLTLRGGLGIRPSSPVTFPYLNCDVCFLFLITSSVVFIECNTFICFLWCSLLQPSLWYHSSAVLALALDALTVPYRLRDNSVPMWQVSDALAVSGRKVSTHC